MLHQIRLMMHLVSANGAHKLGSLLQAQSGLLLLRCMPMLVICTCALCHTIIINNKSPHDHLSAAG